jgi:hypothetical protein
MGLSVSDFVPTLQPMVENVSVNLRYVCYFVLTGSLIVRTARAENNLATMIQPIVTAAVLTGLIATLPFWFNLLRDTFWEIAVSIRQEFAGNPISAGSELLKSLKPSEEGIDWLDVSGSLWKAVQCALAWIIVFIGGIVQLPMLIVQFILECLCYLFLPIAISLFALESTRGLALRYVQQTLAILAWPIGFAVVDMVGYSLLLGPTSVASGLALAAGAATQFTPAKLLIGGIVALWLLLGSLATPFVMQALFCSGTPMSSSVGQAIQLGFAAMGLSKLGKGGASAPALAAAGAGATTKTTVAAAAVPATAGLSLMAAGAMPALMGSMARAALPAPRSGQPVALPGSPEASPSEGASVPAALPLPPRGHTQPRRKAPTYDLVLDPSGEKYAVDMLALNQIPQPVRY